jgi:glycosyltransferase involved in cell wall biosynthesis
MITNKILIISYIYYPIISPRAFRWTAIAEYWARKGHSIDVICAWKPGLSKDEIINEVQLHRVGGIVVESLKSLVKENNRRKDTSMKSFEVEVSYNIRSKTVNLIKRTSDYTWKKLYWPDYACLWYFSATSKAKKLLKKRQYDCIISVSHPFTGHLVGLNLKDKYPQTKWVVDIGDPFSFLDETPNNNNKLYYMLNNKYEGKVFEKADAISVTTEPTLKKYAQIFPGNASKISVIPPLLSQEIDCDYSDSVFSGKEKIRLVFIGSLFKTIRSPEYLLRLFNKLLEKEIGDKLELHFFGGIKDCQSLFDKYQLLLGNKIFLHGKVSKDKANQAMKEASILINIGNNTSYQLPSKVVDYASTGKPVLNIAKSSSDSSSIFFSSYSPALSLWENNNYLDLTTINLVAEFIKTKPVVDPKTIEAWLEHFKIDKIADSYSSVIAK